jgi:hypothetical protein
MSRSPRRLVRRIDMRLIQAFIVLLVCVSSALGQLQPNVTLMEASSALLPMMKVQTELKLTATQKDQLKGVFTHYAEEAQRIVKNAKSREEAQQQIVKIREDSVKKALAILNSSQKIRLRQLGLQAYGPFAALAPDVAGELKLTAAQKQKMLTIQRQITLKAQAVYTERAKAVEAIPKPKDAKDQKLVRNYQARVQATLAARSTSDQKRLKAIQEDGQKLALGVLTAAQKKQWAAMLGRKFPI